MLAFARIPRATQAKAAACLWGLLGVVPFAWLEAPRQRVDVPWLDHKESASVVAPRQRVAVDRLRAVLLGLAEWVVGVLLVWVAVLLKRAPRQRVAVPQQI